MNKLKTVGTIPDKLLLETQKQKYGQTEHIYYDIGNPANKSFAAKQNIQEIENGPFEKAKIWDLERLKIFIKEINKTITIKVSRDTIVELIDSNKILFGELQMPIKFVVSGQLKPVTIESQMFNEIKESSEAKRISLKEIKKNYLYKDKAGRDYYVFDIGYTVLSSKRESFLKKDPEIKKAYLVGQLSYDKFYFDITALNLTEEIRPLTDDEIAKYNEYITSYSEDLKIALKDLQKEGKYSAHGSHYSHYFYYHKTLSIYGLQPSRKDFVNKWVAYLALQD